MSAREYAIAPWEDADAPHGWRSPRPRWEEEDAPECDCCGRTAAHRYKGALLCKGHFNQAIQAEEGAEEQGT